MTNNFTFRTSYHQDLITAHFQVNSSVTIYNCGVTVVSPSSVCYLRGESIRRTLKQNRQGILLYKSKDVCVTSRKSREGELKREEDDLRRGETLPALLHRSRRDTLPQPYKLSSQKRGKDPEERLRVRDVKVRHDSSETRRTPYHTRVGRQKPRSDDGHGTHDLNLLRQESGKGKDFRQGPARRVPSSSPDAHRGGGEGKVGVRSDPLGWGPSLLRGRTSRTSRKRLGNVPRRLRTPDLLSLSLILLY